MIKRPDAFLPTGRVVDGPWVVHPWVYSPSDWKELDGINAAHGIRFELGGKMLGLSTPKATTRVKRRLLVRPTLIDEEDEEPVLDDGHDVSHHGE